MRTGSYSSRSLVVMIEYLSSLLVVMVSGDQEDGCSDVGDDGDVASVIFLGFLNLGDDGGVITAEEVAVGGKDTDDGNEERVIVEQLILPSSLALKDTICCGNAAADFCYGDI
eukprot:9171893-Ditylum_brightwellii.AAC.1